MSARINIIVVLIVGLFLTGLLLPVAISDNTVPAHILDGTPTHVWTPTSGNLASTDANWDVAAAPALGDAVVFDAGSTACTWDLTTFVGNFSITAGYTGIITQTASFGIQSYYQLGGTFTGDVTKVLTDSGNFIQPAGTITNAKLQLAMTGLDKIMNIMTTNYLRNVTFLDDITTFGDIKPIQLYIGAGVILNNTYKFHYYPDYSYSHYLNLGTITGAGYFAFQFHGTTQYILPGDIDCEVYAVNSPAAVNAKMILRGNTVFGGNLRVNDEDTGTTKTFTLDGNGSTVGVAGTLYVYRGGIIDQGTETWTLGAYNQYAGGAMDPVFNMKGNIISGDVNISDGTFNPKIDKTWTCSGSFNHTAGMLGTNLTLVMTGTDKYLQVKIDSLKNLTINPGASIILGCNNIISNCVVNNGAIVQSGKRINITGSNMNPLTGNGTFDGNLYLSGATALSYEIWIKSPMGYLHTDRETKINIWSTVTLHAWYVKIVPSEVGYMNVTIHNETSIRLNESNPASHIDFTISGLTWHNAYDIRSDGVLWDGYVEVDWGGYLNFTYDGNWTTGHDFLVEEITSNSDLFTLMVTIVILGCIFGLIGMVRGKML